MSYKDIILEALDSEEKLSEWEWDFIQSVASRPDDWVLSRKQTDVLDKIEAKLDA